MITSRARAFTLYATVFAIASAGLVYELVAGALASFVLGDSVSQFSLVIGVYLSALGVGSYASKLVGDRVARRFVDIELATALVGGTSAPVLLFAFARGAGFPVVLFATVLVTGVLVGLELPLLLRLLRAERALSDVVAKALFFDYAGALVASVLFALVLVPRVGLVRTSLLFGLVNAVVALATTWLLEAESPGDMRKARPAAVIVLALLAALLVVSEPLTRAVEAGAFADPIVLAKQTPYQRIVVTKARSTALFLDGNLQLSSADERRYHEALVHPAAAAIEAAPRTALVLGGGDGLAARELLRYPSMERVVLVDLDPTMTSLARTMPEFVALNGGALDDPRVHVENDDAFVWVERARETFDLIVVDFPDPNALSLGKLYTTRFFSRTKRLVAPGGAMAVQATSPFFAPDSFSCIVATIRAAGLFVLPYRAYVPSFGDWGFVLAAPAERPPPQSLRVGGLTTLDDRALAALFVLPPDEAPRNAPVTTLDTELLVRLYDREMSRFAAF